MRVVHAIWSFELGGSEAMLIDIVNRQVGRVDVHLLIGNAVVDEELLSGLSKDVSVHRVGRPPGSRNPWYIYRMSRVVHSLHADIVHAHSPTIISAIPFCRARMVLTVHDTGIQLPVAAGRYDLVASISKAVQADLCTSPNNLASTVIYNGIDFGSIVPRQWGARSGPFRIVQVSRLVVEKKGQDILLEAIRRISDKLGSGTVRADFIGDGPDLGDLRRMAARLGVEQDCRFLGAIVRRDVYRTLPTYDLLVQPSRYEGFGLTVVEGVAAGLPVLCSDIEGPREILEHVPNRYLFAPGSASDCARQLLEVIEDSAKPGFGLEMQANREALCGLFDVDETASAYLREYERLVQAV